MCALRDIDRAAISVGVPVTQSMIIFKLSRVSDYVEEDVFVDVYLLHEWQHVISSPALRLPRIIVGTLATGVHHPIDG